MATDYSFDELMGFLDFLGRKGLMNKSTVVGRKAACNKMLSILDDQEKADLRRINIDQLATQFANLQGKDYAPKSLRVYKSRVSGSLDDFFRYRDNPANFSVGAKPRKRMTSHSQTNNATSSNTDNIPQMDRTTAPTQHDTINVPIALSTGNIVQINGLPVGLAAIDAKKIANVIMAMANSEG